MQKQKTKTRKNKQRQKRTRVKYKLALQTPVVNNGQEFQPQKIKTLITRILKRISKKKKLIFQEDTKTFALISSFYFQRNFFQPCLKNCQQKTI